jgi:integrase
MRGYSVQQKGDRWYVVFVHKGKQVWRTTHMSDKAAAERVAPMIREAFLVEAYQEIIRPKVQLPPPVATIGDLITAYGRASKRCNGIVEARTLSAFRSLVRAIAGCVKGEEGKQSCAILTRENAQRWQAMRQALPQPDLSTRRAGNITINSTWGASMGLFSRTVRESAGYRALILPATLPEFLSTPLLPVPRTGWKPWPREAYEAMRAAGDAIADPELRLAHQLLRRLGLRTGELKAASTEWIVPMPDGRWGLWVKDYPAQAPHPFQIKGAEARLLPLPADLVPELLTRRQAGGYLIRGDRHFRVVRGKVQIEMPLVDETHCQWLRKFCPGVQKPNHDLRKWVGSIVYTSQGAEAARKFLGHADLQTTIRDYADYLNVIEVDSLWSEIAAVA